MYINHLFATSRLAINVGNNNTIVANKEGLHLREPSLVALTKPGRNIVAAGGEAYQMPEKIHSALCIVKPLRNGVIADHDSASKMLRALVSKVYPYRHPSGEFELVIASIPYDSTQVEKPALLNALKTFQGKQTCLVCEPLAAAFGLDRDIGLQDGKLIVDIGGGITEMAIVSLSGIVACHSLPVAGDTFDEEIQGYFRRKYNMSIGVKTAEQIKLQVGAVKEDIVFVPPPYPVLGKDLQSGIPVQQMIRYQEVVEILDKSILKIEQCILRTLEQCPLNYPLISISIALC